MTRTLDHRMPHAQLLSSNSTSRSSIRCSKPSGELSSCQRRQQLRPRQRQRRRQQISAAASGAGGGGSRGFQLDPEILTTRDVPLSRLQALLEQAIEEEDYDAAAQLRDELQ